MVKDRELSVGKQKDPMTFENGPARSLILLTSYAQGCKLMVENLRERFSKSWKFSVEGSPAARGARAPRWRGHARWVILISERRW